MGYGCPVCEDPQADETHLANHLAFTAMLRDDGHETWLAEHVTNWESLSPPELADRLVDHVEETEFPQVFEDTTDDHAHDHESDDARRSPTVDQSGDLDTATREVLEEARELTRQRRTDDSETE
ncbi:DUF5810 domain-containing protein [Haloarculaceae archaeon H-GB2-1]|nr:DUF5810 domain-containing protein [Haloarculaceae archaeon H-GB1-1]MEA5406670.1 DUF5810 domain-containing protein [Haloarculaceae archaeon H-GB2-1]